MKILKIVFLFTIMTSIIFPQLPPIIDREIFFGDPEISGAQLSPDGKYITFIKPFNNVRNIWVKDRNQKFDDARPLTNDTARPVTQYFWTRDSKYVLFVQDKGGNENFHIYAVDPSEKGNPVPAARDLTPIEGVRAYIYDVPKKFPNEIIVGMNDRKPELHDVYKINISSGERTLLRKNDENVAAWIYDLNANLRLGYRQTADGGTELLKVDGDKLIPIYSVNNEETCGPNRFSEDGNSFYLTTNKGNIDKIQFELFDLKTGKTKLIEKDPLNQVDFGGAMISDKTNKLLATFYVGEKRRMYFHDKDFEKEFKRMEKSVPKGDLSITDMTDDEMIWLVYVGRDVDPGSIYIYDVKTGKSDLLYKSRPKLPTEQLAEMNPVKYKVRDGMTIYGYLTLPKGIPSKNLPTVMLIHGGPWARDFWGYNPMAQFLANRGYAVFQPNFRGSTGYGKKYLNSGNKQWGTGSMQHDITDAVQFLIKKGISDPKRVSIAGGSYGGYATLAGLAFTPDLYACGFDIVGPSNITTLLNSIPPYWKPIKSVFDVRVGKLENPEDQKRMEEQSPLNSATKIKAPLFVVQGANDPRVKKAESDQIVVALRDLGRQVEYMCAPDEGHGFAGQENRLAMMVAMEKFFAKHLKGREQSEIRDVIKKKYDDITVDIKTVTLPKKESSENLSMPKFNGNKVNFGEHKYAVKINSRGQEFSLNVSRTISKAIFDGKKVIRTIEVSEGIMSGNDTLYFDLATCLPFYRSSKQGPGTMTISISENSIEGEMAMGPQKMPLSVKIDKPVLMDGIGVELPFSTLDLNVGFKAGFEKFDIMSASSKAMKLDVVAEEKVKTEAGEFDCFKIEIRSVEGNELTTTYWFAKNQMINVKTLASLPAMAGGGSITSTLIK